MKSNRPTAHPLFALALIAVVGLATASPALAVDGVIEINQAKVMAAGGFPYTISNPGSYRLTSDLDVTKSGQASPENLTAVTIGANNVTLDLNGFSVLGPATCTWPGGIIVGPCTWAGTGSGDGINSSAKSNIVIRNGIVTGMGSNGIEESIFGGWVTVERVTAATNGGAGILLNGGGSVLRCVAMRNQRWGIYLNTGLVDGNVAAVNGSPGIFVLSGTASGNKATGNTGDGIQMGILSSGTFGNLAVDNTADTNGGWGLHIMGNGGYRGNVLTGNSGSPGNINVNGGLSLGPNLCDAALCP